MAAVAEGEPSPQPPHSSVAASPADGQAEKISHDLEGFMIDSTVFGEALLCRRGAVHTATVRAVGYCRTARLTREVLEHVLTSEQLEYLYEVCLPVPQSVVDQGWQHQGLKRFRLQPGEVAMQARVHVRKASKSRDASPSRDPKLSDDDLARLRAVAPAGATGSALGAP